MRDPATEAAVLDATAIPASALWRSDFNWKSPRALDPGTDGSECPAACGRAGAADPAHCQDETRDGEDQVKVPVVELDGDEMTRIIWGFIRTSSFFPISTLT